MVSPFGMSEVKRLISSGIALTPEEICTVNALGLQAENAADAANVLAAPRVAWCGETPLYQPTIQSEQWFRQYALEWWTAGSLFYALAWSMAHAREPGYFETWTNERSARRAIVAWYRGLACTEPQIVVAVRCAQGPTQYFEEKDTPESQADEPLPADAYTELVNEAIACGLGLSVAEIHCMTPGQLRDIIQRWTRNQIALAGGGTKDAADTLRKSALAKLTRYVLKIEERSKPNGNG